MPPSSDVFESLKAIAPWVSILLALGSLWVVYRSAKAASADREEKRRSDIETRRANYLRRLSDFDLRSSTNLKECENMRRVILRMHRRQKRDVFSQRLANYVRVLTQELSRTRSTYAKVLEMRGSVPDAELNLRQLNEMEAIIDEMKRFNLKLDQRTGKFIEGVNSFVIQCE